MEFQTRKSVHVNLTKGTHANFRKVLFEKHLSMQEVFEEFASRVANNDPAFISILNQLVANKKTKNLSKLKSSDTDTIFDAIEDQNPLT